METVWERAAEFARFGKPIHITEVTVVSGPPRPDIHPGNTAMDWYSTPEGEQEQADYLEQFYSLLFSHPSVQAISYWDLSDRGAWMGAPAGLLHKDMTPKPAYIRLMRLIHHDWWTDAHGRSNRRGVFQTRSYYGDYRITVTDQHGRSIARMVSFPVGQAEKTMTFRL